jgi:hypothetical protein
MNVTQEPQVHVTVGGKPAYSAAMLAPLLNVASVDAVRMRAMRRGIQPVGRIGNVELYRLEDFTPSAREPKG